jgi:hypothetical protein
MPSVLVCTQGLDVDVTLAGTILGREGVDRTVTGKPDAAAAIVKAMKPALVLVDRDLPWADRFIASVRESADTRAISIAVIARGDFDPAEVAMLESGANAILRYPPGPEWDERVPRLMSVPVRKETRFPVSFQVDTLTGGGESFPALALNLSINGMLVESSTTMAVGDALVLAFRLPDQDDEIRVKARPVRVAETDRYGLEFDDVSKPDRARLGRYLGTLS